MEIFFVAIFALAYLFLALKRLEWAVLFLLAALPAYVIRFTLVVLPMTALELMILLSFAVWLFTRTKFTDFLRGKYGWADLRENRKKRQGYPYALEISLILILSYLAVAVARFSPEALGIWKAYFFEPLLVLIMVENLFRGIAGVKKVMWAIFASALYISIYALWQKFTGLGIANPFWANAETRRVTSLFAYPNAVGLYLAPIMMLAFGFVYQGFSLRTLKGKSFLSAVLVFVLSLLAIYFAKSEGAIIGAVAGLMLFGLLAGKRARLVTLVFVLGAVLSVAAYTPLRTYAVEKITLKDLSGEIRKQQWRETWQMLSGANFFLGAGLANYQKEIAPFHQEGIFFNKENDPDFRRKIVIFDDKYRAAHWQPVEIYMYPHNFFLNFWTEIGLFGMLIFGVLIIRFFYITCYCAAQAPVTDKFLVFGLISAMAATLVHGLVDVPYFKNDLAVLFWLLITMSAMLKLEIENIREKNE